jgi:hypothetical protein
MSNHIVDQDARDMAREALAKINSHEVVCAQRYGSLERVLAEIKGVLWWGTTGLIGSMAALIGWLATHPPH